jgi:hypothetical protein
VDVDPLPPDAGTPLAPPELSLFDTRCTAMSESHKNDQNDDQTKKHDRMKNEGEGNRTADRQYRESVRRHVESGASESAAEEAQHALEGAEGDELRRAEPKAKAGRKPRRDDPESHRKAS